MGKDKFLMNPADVYTEPNQVLQDTSLTRDQKMEILKQWEYDARELEVAEEENMAGGTPSLLREVHKAILALGGSGAADQSPTTKQG